MLHVLNLFAAWFLLHAFQWRPKLVQFLFMAACLIASAYWAPAFKKLLIGWLYDGELSNMLVNSYAHGWLAFLDKETIVELSKMPASFDWPMRIFVFAIEAGCLFLLWRRGYAVLLLTFSTLLKEHTPQT